MSNAREILQIQEGYYEDLYNSKQGLGGKEEEQMKKKVTNFEEIPPIC